MGIKRDGLMKKIYTACCALSQLSANDHDSMWDIRELINEMKKDAEDESWTPAKLGGERALFCITTPSEKNLERNLRVLGFEVLTTFNRRRGYPPGQLKFWFISW